MDLVSPGETTPSRHRAAIVVMCCGGIAVSLGGLFVRSLEAASAWQFNVYRGVVGGVALTVILVLRYRGGAIDRVRRLDGVVWLGAGCLGVAAVFYILSLQHTTVANTQFMLSAAPFLTAALAWLSFAERLRRRTIIAMSAALLGVVVMVGEGLATGHVYGDMMALLTVAMFSSYAVIMRSQRAEDMLPVIIVASFVTALAGAIGAFGDIAVSARDLVLGVVWGLTVGIGGDWCFVIAVRHLAAAESTLLLMMLPSVFGPLWVWLAFDEVPSVLTLAGGVLVLAAVSIWAARESPRREQRELARRKQVAGRQYSRVLHLPRWAGGLPVRWSTAFAALFFFSTLARAILVSVLPLQALELLGDAQSVSVLYFVVAAFGIAASISAPAMLDRLGSHATFLIGALFMVLSALLLASSSTPAFVTGMFCHFLGIAATEIAINFYLLAQVPRRELPRFEPVRILFTVVAYAIGPWLGVYLETEIDHSWPYALSMVAVFGSIAHFFLLGLADSRKMPPSHQTVNPLRHVRRFAAQPRMRLAWTLALARSSWWLMFVVYTPIYGKLSGLGELVGAAVVSIGTAATFTVTFWGWVARRYGLRRLLVAGFLASGVLSIAAFALSGQPWLAVFVLVSAAFGATVLDGGGNVPFLRAVRARERAEMTGVFLTFRDSAQLAAPGLFAVLLLGFELPVVFAAAGVWMLLAAQLSRYIPRRM